MDEWLNDPSTIDPTFSLLPQDEQQAILATLKQAAKDASTTTKSPTTAGFTTAQQVLPQVTAEIEIRHISDEEKRLRELKRVEDERAECTGCTGNCRKTLNRGYFPEFSVEDGVEVVRQIRCKFAKQRDLARKVRSSRIPDRYVGKTLEDYRVDAANRVAVDFAKNAFAANKGAYFYGECGCGKTYLASIIAQDFLRRGKSVIFVKVPGLLDDIKATFNGQGREVELLDELRTATLVVLDDFGMEKPTQWAGATLCKVLDMRYDNPTGTTLITSNLSPSELADRLNNASDGANLNGSRIFDRLKEICKPILLKGTSRRN